jgi:hypothetical protein
MIKAYAATAFRKYGCSVPVDPLHIIESEDELELHAVALDEEFEAVIGYNKETDKFNILVQLPKAEADPIRARFTLAHELGHYFINEHAFALSDGETPRHNGNGDNLRYRFPVPMSGSLAEVLAEVEADCFAANLLVPEDALKKYLASELTEDRKISKSIVKHVAKHFQVSYKCAGSAVVHVTDQSCALAVYPVDPNRVPWLEVSESFDRQFGLDRNSRLKPLRRHAGETCELLDDWIEGVRLSQKNQLINVGVINGTHDTAAFLAT